MNLRDLRNWAREEGIVGFSRMSKAELMELWEESQPERPRKKENVSTPIIFKAPKTLLDSRNKKIPVPILVPERRDFPSRRIPSVIEQNVETVSDWLNWLESADDVDIRRRSNPAVERLKKQIENLWGRQFVVEERRSALNGFARQLVIQGDNSPTPQDFLRRVRGDVVKLIKQNRQTKIKCVLVCLLVKPDLGDEAMIEDTPFSHSRMKRNLEGTDAGELFDEMGREMMVNLENFNRRGSNWAFERVIRLEIHLVRWRPLGGSSYIPLSKEVANKNAVVNMKNGDEQCFKWCMTRATHMVAQNPERITPLLRKQAEEFDWSGMTFPTTLADIEKFERRNGISVNVFGWDGKLFPLRVTDEEKEKHVDLLLLKNEFKSHFCIIKNFSRLAGSQVSRTGHQRFFCKRCISSFPSEESLRKHQSNCVEFEAAKIVMPEGECSFSNFSKMIHVPVVGYADFESILKPVEDEGRKKAKPPKTQKMQEHLPCGFAFHLVSPFLEMEPVLKRAGNEKESKELPKEFIRKLIEEVKKAQLGLKQKKMIPLSQEEWGIYNHATFCWLCRGEFEGKGEKMKVRDHCHFTGKFRGAAHRSCNRAFQRPKFTPVFFHNLANYDSHLFVRALGTLDEVLDVQCIPNNEEKYISFSLKFELKRETTWDGKEIVVKHEIRFLDSFKFMASALGNLVGNLPKVDLTETARFFQGEKFDLMTRKGVYPYEFMDSFEKFDGILPEKEAFFSRLNDAGIGDDDWQHAKNVWEKWQMKNMGEFHDLYLKTDVLLLADVVENFRKLCEKNYELDPAHFFTTPGMAWNAMLKITGVKLELLNDVDMLLMVERGMRGGNSNAFKRYAKANNKFMEDFDASQSSKFIVYLDANNLYGWAMSKPLPVGDFRWMKEDELRNWKEFVDEEGVGCILEVDLEYPEELHDSHNDFPLAPESLKLGGVWKLTQNLRDKKNMVLHGENLKLYLSLGMKLKKVRRGIAFREEAFMKSYIDKNTKLRMNAKNAFEKDFFKLMNNSVFGKTMENVRKRVCIELVKDAERAEKLVNKSNFADLQIFDEFLIAVKMRKTQIVMNKPVYVGMSILDLSKTLMYDFHYNYAKKKWKDLQVLYTDTDSLVYEIGTEDFFADIVEDVKERFDTNDFPKDHPAVLNGLPIVKENKKKIGLMKDECGGKMMKEFVALRPKLYAFLLDEGKEEKKAKGVKKCVIKKQLRFENFVKCLKGEGNEIRKQNVIRSRQHHLYTERMEKIALSNNDDKLIVLENGIDTFARGHWRLGERKEVEVEVEVERKEVEVEVEKEKIELKMLKTEEDIKAERLEKKRKQIIRFLKKGKFGERVELSILEQKFHVKEDVLLGMGMKILKGYPRYVVQEEE